MGRVCERKRGRGITNTRRLVQPHFTGEGTGAETVAGLGEACTLVSPRTAENLAFLLPARCLFQCQTPLGAAPAALLSCSHEFGLSVLVRAVVSDKRTWEKRFIQTQRVTEGVTSDVLLETSCYIWVSLHPHHHRLSEYITSWRSVYREV